MRRFAFVQQSPDTEEGPGTTTEYEGIRLLSGWCVVSPIEPRPRWKPTAFASLVDLEAHMGPSEFQWLDEEEVKSATTTPRPAPQPCPLPNGDCTTPPDVVTGG